MMYKTKQKEKGFTLIEILVAMGIISVVFGVVITSALTVQKNGRDAKRQSDLRSIQVALENYYADNQYYPNQLADVTTGRIYLKTIPQDPRLDSASREYCYEPKAKADLSSCDNSASSRCHYYILCGQFENPSVDIATTCACGGKTYNFQVNPR